MTKKTKIYFFIIVITLIIAIVYGIITKGSFKGNIYLSDLKKESNLDEYSLQLFDVNNNYFDNDIKDISDLEEKSDLIVKVKVEGKRKLYLDATKTEVKIIKKYCGNDIYKEGGLIYVYEPAAFIHDADQVYNSTYGYQLMKEDIEYILFLKNLDKVDRYKYNNDEESSFLPISTLYSKYSLDEKGVCEVIDEAKVENSEYLYNNIKNYPILTYDYNELHKYNELLMKAKDKYKKNT